MSLKNWKYNPKTRGYYKKTYTMDGPNRIGTVHRLDDEGELISTEAPAEEEKKPVSLKNYKYKDPSAGVSTLKELSGAVTPSDIIATRMAGSIAMNANKAPEQGISNSRGDTQILTGEPYNLTREGQWAAKHPIAGTLMYGAANLVGGAEGFINTGEAALRALATGEKMDPNVIHAAPIAQAFRTGAAEGFRREAEESHPRISSALGIDSDDGRYTFGEKAADFLTGVGADAVSSSISMATGGPLSTLLMGGSAANQSLYETSNDPNTTARQAAELALANGAAEAFFEHFSVERLLNFQNPTSTAQAVRTALAQAGVEASEEMFTEIANTLSDIAIRKDYSERGREYQDYIKQGMDPNAAATNTMRSAVTQIFLAGLGGALSGGLHTGMAMYGNTLSNGMDLRRDIRNGITLEDIAGSIDTSTAEGQRVQNLANDIAQREASGTMASDTELGYLRNAIANAAEVAERNEAVEGAAAPVEGAVDGTQDVVSETTERENTARQAATQAMNDVASETAKDTGEAFRNANYYNSQRMTAGERIFNAEMAEDMASTFGEEGQKAFSALPADEGVKAYREWAAHYNNMRFGMPIREGMSTTLSPEQISAAMRAGALDANRAYPQDTMKAMNRSVSKIKVNGVNAGVADRSGINYNSLTPQQKLRVDYTEAFVTKGLGMDVRYVQSDAVDGKYRGMNGSFQVINGRPTMTLDVNAGMNRESDWTGDITDIKTMLPVISHETTHFLEQYNPKLYKELSNTVITALQNNGTYSKGMTINSIIEAERQRLNDTIKDENGKPVQHTQDDAIHELVARACEDMLSGDKKALDAFNSLDAQTKQTLWDHVKQVFDNIREFFAQMLSSYKSDSAEAKAIRQNMEEFEKIRDMWMNALDGSHAEDIGINIDTATESAAPTGPELSYRSWNASDWVQYKKEAAKELADALGVSTKTATKYINDVNSVAKMIFDDQVRLDYDSSEGRSAFVSNTEYGGSIDFSTLCKKRLLYTGTIQAIQNLLPNTALTPSEYLQIRQMMLDAGHEVTCGLCYVEGSRVKMGVYTKEFIEKYKKTNPEYVPTMAEMNTPDGQEKLRSEHPEVYDAYVYFMNHYGTLSKGEKALFASQQKPKLYTLRTEYKGEIKKKFGGAKNRASVADKNLNGGLRIQSFSDFEIVHMIDMMQVIMDMSEAGLAGQAYTKVPEFADSFGRTGLKINCSLITKGVDENGNLIFDDREGMKHERAFELRDKYSKNVGTVLVVFNQEQLRAALADDRIDYVLPFHKSQWTSEQYDAIGLPEGTIDFTNYQNDYIKGAKSKENVMPMEYWDFSKSGRENAERYLQICAEEGRTPKFARIRGENLLIDNGDGTWSLPDGPLGDGYFKLLIDFKMYDNNGKGARQMPVRPNFSMDEIRIALNDYKGGHRSFPVANDIVQEFVDNYKKQNPRTEYSTRDSQGKELTESQAEYFKDSKVRDAEGNLKVMYHGTNGDFNIFDPKKMGGANGTAEGFGIYLSDRTDVSDAYGDRLIKAYVNVTKPATSTKRTITRSALKKLIKATAMNEASKMVADGDYKNVNEAVKDSWISNYTNTYEKSLSSSLDDVVNQMFRMDDNDMGIIQEVMAGMGIRNYEEAYDFYDILKRETGFDGFETWWTNNEKPNDPARIVLAFDSNQVKNTDNLNPTENSDIRYSTRSQEMDAEYQEALEANNEDWQLMLVDQAAYEAGYTTTAYHGSPFTDINVFNTRSQVTKKTPMQLLFGTHFTQSLDYAKLYAQKAKNSKGTSRMTTKTGRVYKTYLDLGKSLDLRTPANITPGTDEYKLYEDAPAKYKKKYPPYTFSKYDTEQGLGSGQYITKATIENVLQAMSPKDATDFLIDHGYNSVLYDANYATPTTGNNRFTRDPSIIMLDPERIKSGDPVTYDDNGNVIPLSERFNSENSDIRYSTRDIEEAADSDDRPDVIRQGSYKDIQFSTRIAEKNLDNRLRVNMATFFSGTGTVDFALRNIVRHEFAVEYDAKIAAVYRANNGDNIYVDDVRNVNIDSHKGKVEYFHASPVCKSYSKANNDMGEKPLDIETARATANAIRTLQPKVVTVENVARYRNSEAVKIIEEALEGSGYDYDVNVYSATDFGGATIRQRMFIRAVKDGVLPKVDTSEHARSWYSVVKDLIPELPETKLSNYMEERLEPSGIDIDNLSQPVFVLGGEKSGKLTYATADKPAPTLLAKSTEAKILMPDGRVLRATPRVMARIQGLPDGFDLMEKEQGITNAYKVVGNGVPVQLTQGIVGPLLEENLIRQKSEATGVDYSQRDVDMSGTLDEFMERMDNRFLDRLADLDGEENAQLRQDLEDAYRANLEWTISEMQRRMDSAVGAEKKKAKKRLDALRARKNQRIDEVIADFREKRFRERVKRSERKAQQELLRRARRLAKKKGDPNFRAQVDALIGDLDLVAAGIRSDTRSKLEEIKKQVEAQSELDPDYAKYEAPKYADLIGRLGKKHISQMKIEDIVQLTESIVALEHSKRTADREIKEGVGRTFGHYGKVAVEQQSRIKGINYKNEIGAQLGKYKLNMLNPVRAFSLIDGYQRDGVFTYFGKQLNDGQTKAAQFRMDVEKMFQDIDNNPKLVNDFAKQNIEIDTLEGKKKISKGMRIALYLHLQNAENVKHIAFGGITIPNERLYSRGKYAEAYAAGETVHLSEWIPGAKGESVFSEINRKNDAAAAAAIRKITDQMTPEELEYAKIAEKFFNETTKNAINEVSLELNGYEKATVEHYFPISTNKNFLQSSYDGLVKDGTLEGMGMLKERSGSPLPIYLEDASQVVLRQKNNTALYYGLAVPIRNFTRFYNYTGGERLERSVKASVGKTWGKTALDYIDNVLSDLQFGRQTQRSITDTMKSIYAGTTLNLNLGVAIKQSASYPFAASVIGWGPLAKAARHVVSKADREYMDSITPWGYMRRTGFSGTEMGEVAMQRTGIDNNRTIQRVKTALDLIRQVDVRTTEVLFFACEEYVKDKYPDLEVRGGEYNRRLADIYNETLQRTQPSYDVMQRNEYLRKQNDIAKIFGAFKTQTFNMGGEVIDAWSRWRAYSEYAKKDISYVNAKKEAGKAFGNTVAATIVAQGMLVILSAAANAALHRMRDYRDDKGEVTPESIAKKILHDFGTSFAGMTMGGSEAQDFALALLGDGKWYDIDYPGLTLVNDFASAAVDFRKAASKAVETGDMKDIDNASVKMAKLIMQMFKLQGVPAQNVYNIVNAIYLWGTDVKNGEAGTFNAGEGLFGLQNTSPSKEQYAKQAIDAYKSGDIAKGDRASNRTSKDAIKKAMGGKQDDAVRFLKESGLGDTINRKLWEKAGWKSNTYDKSMK